jgi:tyrosyl-tRNA synthetase
MNIITDKKRIAEVLERGVEKIFPDKKTVLAKMLSGERLKLYCGFDPSAPSLHIGNAILLNKLAQFQALGHEVIFLIGDFTGMIGDPTDKSAARQTLTREEVMANAKHYQKQASIYLDFHGDNKAKVMYNSDWHDDLSFKDLIGLASNFTVQQMLAREMFQERLKKEKPIFLHEFLYPLAQAYDSVAMDVDLEIGGNDQMFNMLCGRDLMKALGKKDKAVMTLKILADAGGVKMGKTTGNALFLDTDSANMYGIVMSWPDEVIVPAMELATTMDWEEIKTIAKELKEDANPRDAKMRLARELTAMCHGVKEAEEAGEHFKTTIQHKTAPADMRSLPLKNCPTVLDGLISYFGETKSKSDLRRLIEQGGVMVNNKKVADFNDRLSRGDVIKAGKRDWFSIK